MTNDIISETLREIEAAPVEEVAAAGEEKESKAQRKKRANEVKKAIKAAIKREKKAATKNDALLKVREFFGLDLNKSANRQCMILNLERELSTMTMGEFFNKYGYGKNIDPITAAPLAPERSGTPSTSSDSPVTSMNSASH